MKKFVTSLAIVAAMSFPALAESEISNDGGDPSGMVKASNLEDDIILGSTALASGQLIGLPRTRTAVRADTVGEAQGDTAAMPANSALRGGNDDSSGSGTGGTDN
jgi:hypothetical protein